jgi:hypothetical protein
MKIQERITDTKRHTLGYVISGKEYTRKQAVQLAKKGSLEKVRVVNSQQHGPHISGIGWNLYDLPVRLNVRRAARRAKK